MSRSEKSCFQPTLAFLPRTRPKNLLRACSLSRGQPLLICVFHNQEPMLGCRSLANPWAIRIATSRSAGSFILPVATIFQCRPHSVWTFGTGLFNGRERSCLFADVLDLDSNGRYEPPVRRHRIQKSGVRGELQTPTLRHRSTCDGGPNAAMVSPATNGTNAILTA